MKKIRLQKILLTIFLISIINSGLVAQVKEGDTVKFWSVAYIDWYPTSPPYPPAQYQITAVCRKVGASCYLFFDTTYNHNIEQNYLDYVANSFDSFTYPTFTSLYGAIPIGIDGDPKVYILVGSGDSMWAGYFDPIQGMPDTMTSRLWKRHSSQKEIIYVGNYYWYWAENIAHEFGHLLHWGQDHSPEPPEHPVKYWEEGWVDEGFSTFAEYSFWDTMSLPDRMYYYKSAPGDYSLIWFESYDPSRLIFSYMYEHFGGDLFLKTLISEQANGFEGFRKTLKKLGYSETFDEIFENIVLACYADDRFFENGKYGFYHYNFQSLPVLFRTLRLHSFFPVNNQSGTVRPYSAKYVNFSSTSPKPLSIEFNGDDTLKFRLSFLLYKDKQLIEVRKVSLDSQNNAWFGADSFGTAYNHITMAVINVDSTLGFSETGKFTYSASAYKTGIHNQTQDFISIYPNPASNYVVVKADLNPAFNNSLEVIDQFGKSMLLKVINSNETRIDISTLPPAMYFIKINNGDHLYVRELMKY